MSISGLGPGGQSCSWQPPRPPAQASLLWQLCRVRTDLVAGMTFSPSDMHERSSCRTPVLKRTPLCSSTSVGQNGLPLSAPAVKAGRTGSLHRGSLIRFTGQLRRQSEPRTHFKCRTECSHGGSSEGKQAEVCPFAAWHAHRAGGWCYKAQVPGCMKPAWFPVS